MRVFELADELGVRNADVLQLAGAHGIELETGGDELTDDQVSQLRGAHEFELEANLQLEAAAASVHAPVPQYAPPAGYPSAPPVGPPGPPSPVGPVGPGGPLGAGGPLAPYAVPPGHGVAPAYGGQPGYGAPAGYGAQPGYAPMAAGPDAPHTILLAPGQAPPPGYVLEGGPPQMRSRGMHPLIRSSLWYAIGGTFVPCIGLFLVIRGYQLAGQGRQAVQWSRGRYSGDGLGQAVQIYFWVYLALLALSVVVQYNAISSVPPPPAPVP